jgi:hypothetical protein
MTPRPVCPKTRPFFASTLLIPGGGQGNAPNRRAFASNAPTTDWAPKKKLTNLPRRKSLPPNSRIVVRTDFSDCA